jgi:branched-chain amino acid transport system ATP-binding protein
MHLLNTEDLSISFGGLAAVKGVIFHVNQGDIMGLIGPNGAGKTTLFNLITGFIKPTAGEILYKGEKISGLPPYLIAKQRITRTYQKTSIFPNVNVLENVIIGTHLWTKTRIWGALWKTSRSRKERDKVEERAWEILEFVGLKDRWHFLSKNLPYGEQRKLEIAIALASGPELLLLDEPAAGMNREESLKLMELIQRIRDQGTTVLLVEHDMKVVMGICERIVVLHYGEIIAEGSPAEISENRDVIKVYIGEETLAAE